MAGLHPRNLGQGVTGHGCLIITETSEIKSNKERDPVPESWGLGLRIWLPILNGVLLVSAQRVKSAEMILNASFSMET